MSEIRTYSPRLKWKSIFRLICFYIIPITIVIISNTKQACRFAMFTILFMPHNDVVGSLPIRLIYQYNKAKHQKTSTLPALATTCKARQHGKLTRLKSWLALATILGRCVTDCAFIPHCDWSSYLQHSRRDLAAVHQLCHVCCGVVGHSYGPQSALRLQLLQSSPALCSVPWKKYKFTHIF